MTFIPPEPPPRPTENIGVSMCNTFLKEGQAEYRQFCHNLDYYASWLKPIKDRSDYLEVLTGKRMLERMLEDHDNPLAKFLFDEVVENLISWENSQTKQKVIKP